MNLETTPIYRYGFTPAQREGIEDKPKQSEVQLCTDFINQYLEKSDKFDTKLGSYELKNFVEEMNETYVPNGAFIEAAVNLGIEVRREGDTPNAEFKLQFKPEFKDRVKDVSSLYIVQALRPNN